MKKNKVISISEAKEISQELKKKGLKIVHCHGVFDLLHPGHFRHFEAAKKFGDVLFISITEDKFVNKGPGRPVFTESLRAESLAALEVCDYVFINHHPLAITAIDAIQPDCYVKGQDYKNLAEDITGGIYEEKKAVESHGGKLVFTEEIQYSSTKLINRHIDIEDESIKEYLKATRKQISFEKLKADFEKIAGYKVLIIGDIILDEYQFVHPLGRASKSATISTKRMNSELYAGGVLAVANHISNFVSEVTLVSTYGNNYGINYYDFIKDSLNPNVDFKGIYIEDRPTVHKKRYIERVFKHKLFEIIEIDDTPLNDEFRQKIFKELEGAEKHFDLIVIVDFGHGLIDAGVAEYLSNLKMFMAVNAQTNSANNGFNLISKYQRCDYFSIDKEEARLALHDKHGDIELLIEKLMDITQSSLASVTLGVDGAMIRKNENNHIATAPILSREVVDTIGAGDAFLSITSLMAKNGNTPEEIVFVGNAVGAMAVKIMGNKSFIEKVSLMKYLKTLLT